MRRKQAEYWKAFYVQKVVIKSGQFEFQKAKTVCPGVDLIEKTLVQDIIL